jgi:hypothetical protein
LKFDTVEFYEKSIEQRQFRLQSDKHSEYSTEAPSTLPPQETHSSSHDVSEETKLIFLSTKSVVYCRRIQSTVDKV